MKTAKVVQCGKHQVVILPDEFDFTDSEIFISKTGNMINLIPKSASWDSLFNSLSMFSSDFMSDRVQPDLEKRQDEE